MPEFLAFSLISLALVWAGILALAAAAAGWLFGARRSHVQAVGIAAAVLWAAGAMVPLFG